MESRRGGDLRLEDSHCVGSEETIKDDSGTSRQGMTSVTQLQKDLPKLNGRYISMKHVSSAVQSYVVLQRLEA